MKKILALTIAIATLFISPALLAQTGNLWVGAAGTCTRSGTLVAYNAATSCSSFQAAQTAASGGDTVMVLNGTYGAQNLTTGGKGSTVSYVAQTTGSVIIGGGGLTINIDKVHFLGITGGAASLGTNRAGLDIEALTNTAFTDVVMNCGGNQASWSGLGWKNVFAAGTNITIQGCDFGNWDACDGYNGSGCNANSNCEIEDATRFWSWGVGSAQQPANDSMTGNVIHDVTAPPDGACGSGPGVPHVDGLQVFSGGTNMAITGNKFYGNASSALQSGGGTLSNWTVENNYFGETTCCNNLVWGQATVSGFFKVVNNTIANDNGYTVVNNVSASGAATYDFSSNLVIATPTVCTATGSVSGGFNVFPSSGGALCGTNTKRCTPTFLHGVPAAGNGYDVTLSPSDTCAVGAGNNSDFAPTDIFGTTRPQGSGVDAGAFELPSTSTVAAPTASPVAGTYTGTQTVTLTTSTPSAVICYTVDGTTPTATTPGTCSHGTTYSGTISVATSQTVMAIGTLSGDTNSSVSSFVYVITTAAPTASPVAGTYTGTQSVALSTATGGAAICYTVDGTTPTATTPGTCSHGTTYSTAISVSASQSILAISTITGEANSAVTTFAYVILAVAPTASPAAGTYTGFQTVTLSTVTSGAAICYTTDGSTPTATTPGTCAHGTTYSAPFLVDISETVKAIATKSGNTNSTALSAAYVINHQTWYVRADGGTRTQCTGLTDAAYPGTGSGQACGFLDMRWLYDNQGGSPQTWIIGRGDTVLLESAASISAVSGLIAASTGPANRIGWDYGGPCSGAGCGAGFTWCQGIGNSCGIPPPPAGSPASPTHIWGANHGSCSAATNIPGSLALSNVPDGTKTFELYGDFGNNTVLDLSGTHDIDLQCVHVNTHGSCIIHASTSSLPNGPAPCSASAPISNYASEGIRSSATTGTGISLTDVWVTGMQDSGWFGPINGAVTNTRVRYSYNVMTGFNMDDGTGVQAGGTVTDTDLTLDFNGWSQTWPYATAIPVGYLTTQNTGGDGDGLATPGSSSDTFIENRMTCAYNGQDCYDVGHNQDPGSVSWNHSQAWANLGGTFKSGGESASLINSFSLTNCYRANAAITGVPTAAQTWASPTTQLFCRANGDGVGLNWLGGATGEVLKIQDTTVVTYGGVAVDAQVQGSGTCTACTFFSQGNVYLAYSNPSTGASHNPAMYNLTPPGFGPTTTDHNTRFNFFGDTCAGTDQCVDPLLVSEPPPATPVGDGFGDAFNFNLTAGSPAVSSQIPISGITDDFFAVTRLNPTSAGAAQFVGAGGTVATPTATPGAGSYTGTQSVVLTSSTSGAVLCYTTNGSTPAATTPGTCSTGTTLVNGGAVSVAVSETIKVIGTLVGSTNSTVGSYAYTITAPAVVANPTASPAAGSYTSAQSVTLSTVTAGAAICYTLDGSTPTATTPGTCSHGTTYSGAISVPTTTTIIALGTLSGDTNSSSVTFGYTITITVATPTANPVAGSYAGPQSVALASATSGATICYTLDGTTPTATTPGTCSHGTTYSSTISVTTSETVKAVATKSGDVNSGVLTAAYVITVTPPATTTFGGTVTFGQTITQ